MGGLQAMETGIAHLGYFSWIGAFSSGHLLALSDEFKNALKDSKKINENLRLFEIVGGDNDQMSGPAIPEFESQLRAVNVQHVYSTWNP